MKEMRKYSLGFVIILAMVGETMVVRLTQGIGPVLAINMVSLVFIFILYKIDRYLNKGVKVYVMIPFINLIFLAWTVLLNHYLLRGFPSFNVLLFCVVVGMICFRMHPEQRFSIVVTSLMMLIALGLIVTPYEAQLKLDNPIARATVDYAYQEGVISTKSPESIEIIIRSDEEKNTYEVVLLDLSKANTWQSMSYYAYSNGVVTSKEVY